MNWLAELSWTCHVCGDDRPDEKISVANRPLALSEPWPYESPAPTFNVRYCNDRQACTVVARADGPWPTVPAKAVNDPLRDADG